MSKYITVVLEYKDGQEQPRFGAGMKVLGGNVDSVQFDHALKVIEALEQKNEELEIRCSNLLPEVAEVNLKRNLADIKIEGGLLQVFANQFVETFEGAGAENHLEMTFYHKNTNEQYSVLMQKISGLTQGQKNEALQKELSRTKAELEEAREVVRRAISGLEYSAHNLAEDTNIDKDGRRAMESTCPEATLLIEIRNLKELLSSQQSEE